MSNRQQSGPSSVLLDEGMLCIKMHIKLVPVTLEMIVCVCVTYLEDKCCPLGPRLQTKTCFAIQLQAVLPKGILSVQDQSRS